MSVDVTYFRIERMIRSGAECFLCALEDEIERKYIDAYLLELETISIGKRGLKRLERIEKKLNQLAKNCRMEIERLAKTETIEYSQ